MKRFNKAVALGCVLAVLASCSGRPRDKKDEPPKIEDTQTVGIEAKTLDFPEGVKVAVPKGAVTAQSGLKVTSPVVSDTKSPTPFPGVAKTVVGFDVSLSQNGKSGIQPKQPLTLTVDLTGAWAPNGARPQDAKVYTPIGGRFWLVPSKVEGTTLTMSLGRLSPKYIAYVSDADLVKSFDAGKVKKDPGSCAQQVAVDGGKVKFGRDSRGWSTKPDSPILACLYKGSDGYARIGIVNRVPYVLSVSVDKDIRIEEAPGNSDAELIKALTRQIFPDANTQALVAEGDAVVASVKIDDLPSTIKVKADMRTFFADVIIRDVRLLLSFLKASPTPLGEVTELLDKALGSSSVISCFQDLFEDLGDNPDQAKMAVDSLKCLFNPIMDYVTHKFGLGEIWNVIAFVKDGFGNLIAAAKYAWVGVFAIKETIQVPVVAEMEATFTKWLQYGNARIPLYPQWEVRGAGSDGKSVLDRSTCKRADEDRWKLCARFELNPYSKVPPVSAEEFRERRGFGGLCDIGKPTSSSVGGKPAYYYVIDACREWDGFHKTYVWFVPSEGLEIDYTVPTRGVEMKGIKEALAAITWS